MQHDNFPKMWTTKFSLTRSQRNQICTGICSINFSNASPTIFSDQNITCTKENKMYFFCSAYETEHSKTVKESFIPNS